MNKWLGLVLIIAGLAIGLFSLSEWYTAKSSAQNLTNAEIESFKKVEAAAGSETGKVKEESGKKKPQPQPMPEPTPILTSGIDRQLGEQTAKLIIPKIEQKYSVYWGADPATLKKGVGMYISDLTTVPGGHGHTVLSGHRDTVFVKLGELEKQDQVLLEYEDKIYVYEITDMWITDAEDRSVIVEKDESVLTLTTCYPFDFIGYAPDRYIVQAKLVSTQDPF
ncbi:class D sortase [Planococcus shenhongbingii]|uniref:Class D sortase n=1 Tax=Planococcus shenhongbingii TaxID=3058398 RepID=A0ABT8NF64_9BACL|nr:MULTISPECIES: class D sortase [unclassified Planococcus (in: firmicutes)]MDN7246512.1 class D sortase [Planococcus sp. N017]WKA59498.1 class D sortase [Planococcus sp. N016]